MLDRGTVQRKCASFLSNQIIKPANWTPSRKGPTYIKRGACFSTLTGETCSFAMYCLQAYLFVTTVHERVQKGKGQLAL